MTMQHKKNIKNKPFIIPAWSIIAISSIAIITGCSSSSRAPTEQIIAAPSQQGQPTQHQSNQEGLSTNPYNNNSTNQGQTYTGIEQLPSDSPSAQSIIELESLISREEYNEAERLAREIDRSRLTLKEQARLNLSIATIYSAKNQNSDTLNSLKSIQISLLSKDNAAKYYWLKARALYQSGRYKETLEALANRTDYLEFTQINGNQSMMSSIAASLSPKDLERIKRTSNNQNLLLWLNSNESNFANDTIPLNSFDTTSSNIEGLSLIESSWEPNSPKQIAILLPFSSKFKSIAAEFEKGINNAHELNESPFKPQLRFYDVGSGDIDEKIQLANQNGAEFIIGPLGNQASNFALNSLSNTPIMAIGGNLQNSQTGKYTFSLNPESDAIAIAQHARAQGHIKALVLASDSARGNRLATAFENAWTSLNGTSERQQYLEKEFDHSGIIKLALGIYASENRHQQLTATIGKEAKFNPSRKEQVDMIFLASNFADAKNLKPQLNYHDAHGVPTYGPSGINLINTPAGQKADLDGLIIPEMPALIPQNIKVETTTQTAQDNQRANNTINVLQTRPIDRLEALGFDAYQIIPILQPLNSQTSRYSGKTGMVTINSNGDIQRKPTWVKFSNGKLNTIE
jgi:outer membrane PBP1 activator LpoA protein